MISARSGNPDGMTHASPQPDAEPPYRPARAPRPRRVRPPARTRGRAPAPLVLTLLLAAAVAAFFLVYAVVRVV